MEIKKCYRDHAIDIVAYGACNFCGEKSKEALVREKIEEEIMEENTTYDL